MRRRTLALMVLLLSITLVSVTAQGEDTIPEKELSEGDITEQSWPDNNLEMPEQSWPDITVEGDSG